VDIGRGLDYARGGCTLVCRVRGEALAQKKKKGTDSKKHSKTRRFVEGTSPTQVML
jgi:hypothetical protein